VSAKVRQWKKDKCVKCGAWVQRLDIHLTRTHKINSKSAEYQSLVRQGKDAAPDSVVVAGQPATLECVLDAFELHIQSLAGGSTEKRPAQQKRNADSRVLYSIMGTED